MKHAWIGGAAGVALGVTLVAVTQHAAAPPARRPQGNAAELSARCSAPIAVMYERAAEPLHKYLAAEPAKALDAARGQVANVIQIRLGVCQQALALRQAEKPNGSAEVYRDIARLAPIVDKLDAARARLDELTGALALPHPADAQAKLAALDEAMRALPDGMSSAGTSAPAAGSAPPVIAPAAGSAPPVTTPRATGSAR